MKAAQQRARTRIVYQGLRWLLEQDEPQSRRKFLQPDVHPDGADKAMIEEMGKKAWQTATVARLFENGILVGVDEGSQEKYEADPDAVRALLKDHDNGGVHLSWLIFPGDVPTPAAYLPAASEPAHEGPRADDPPDWDWLTAVSRDLEQLKGETNGTRKQLRTLSDNVAKVYTLVNADHATMKHIEQALAGTQEILARLDRLDNRLGDATDAVRDGAAATDRVAQLVDSGIKRSELLRRLDAHLEEGRALRELLLGAAEEVVG